jgi:hypothetical protein
MCDGNTPKKPQERGTMTISFFLSYLLPISASSTTTHHLHNDDDEA